MAQDWINSSPSWNIADVANDTSLHLSVSAAQSNQATAISVLSAELQTHRPELNTHGHVTTNSVDSTAPLEINNNQEQVRPQCRPPSPAAKTFGRPPQLNAPNTFLQLSQATMQFDGLQLGYFLTGQDCRVSWISPTHLPPVNALANDPVETNAPNPPQAQTNAPAVPAPVLNPLHPLIKLIHPAFRIATSIPL